MQHDEEPLSERQSLELIAQMINKAKCDYQDTGVSTLLWGGVISFCSIVNFLGFEMHITGIENVWLLTIPAVVAQVYISIQERKRKKFKGHEDSIMGGIWMSFGISMFLLSFYTGKFTVPSPNAIFLIVYGVPTFAVGFSLRFTPMVIGGLACWVFAVATMYTPFPYSILYSAGAAQLAWFIPGLILRRRYLKAKRGNV